MRLTAGTKVAMRILAATPEQREILSTAPVIQHLEPFGSGAEAVLHDVRLSGSCLGFYTSSAAFHARARAVLDRSLAPLADYGRGRFVLRLSLAPPRRLHRRKPPAAASMAALAFSTLSNRGLGVEIADGHLDGRARRHHARRPPS